VSLTVDLCITHDRFGSSSEPSHNGHLHHPNDLDGSLTVTTPDKIRQYHTDYDNRLSNVISFIPTISSTSDSRKRDLQVFLGIKFHPVSETLCT
jgi:hypothetical protein